MNDELTARLWLVDHVSYKCPDYCLDHDRQVDLAGLLAAYAQAVAPQSGRFPTLKQDVTSTGLSAAYVPAAAAPPQATMQMLIDAGFNAFGLQLFCESFAGKIDPENPKAGLPFSFVFRGLRFTVEHEPSEEIDTRHH